jgi:hypothetical protein
MSSLPVPPPTWQAEPRATFPVSITCHCFRPGNAFIGPGFYSFDLSLARAFTLPWLGEASRLRIPADAYHVLNHANLGNPTPPRS